MKKNEVRIGGTYDGRNGVIVDSGIVFVGDDLRQLPEFDLHGNLLRERKNGN